MTVKEIQSLLSDDEAMVLFAVTVKDSFVVAITRENFDWKPIGRGSEALSGQVADFRRGLDVANASDATGKSVLFNLEFANWLYQHAAGFGRGAGEGQAQSSDRPLGRIDGAAVSFAGDREAARRDPGKTRRLSRCRLAAEASRGVGIAVGRQPEIAAGLCAQGSRHQADDRLRRSAVQPGAGAGRRQARPGQVRGERRDDRRPIPISGAAPASIVQHSARAACRNCRIPPTN